MDNLKRIKEIEETIKQKSTQVQQIDQMKNNLVTEILREQGKLQLLNDMEKEKTKK